MVRIPSATLDELENEALSSAVEAAGVQPQPSDAEMLECWVRGEEVGDRPGTPLTDTLEDIMREAAEGLVWEMLGKLARRGVRAEIKFLKKRHYSDCDILEAITDNFMDDP